MGGCWIGAVYAERRYRRLKVLRAERDWSQAKLATQLGVSRQTVNAVERGKYDPSLPLAFEMARVFAQPIESIFMPDEKRVDNDTVKLE